ncbi:MAG: thioredoxin-disulfide reductase [Desulfotomaculales bacterium]
MERELVIVGGGPAGLAAALYAARAGLDTVLYEEGMPGGKAATTERIENYPGFPDGIGGVELMMNMQAQAQRFGARMVNVGVQAIEPGDGQFVLQTGEGRVTARAVILATGVTPRPLNVKGEAEFTGRGISFCATCDGPLFRDRVVAVVGGGDAAVEEALFLSRFARKVYLIHRRDALRATKVLQDRAFAEPKIEFLWHSVVQEVLGGPTVEAVLLRDVRSGETRAVAVDGVFVYIGMEPNSRLVRGLVALDEQGYVITDEEMRTSRPGIFAAGDVRRKTLRQVVTAVADGAIAAVTAGHYLEGLRG